MTLTLHKDQVLIFQCADLPAFCLDGKAKKIRQHLWAKWQVEGKSLVAGYLLAIFQPAYLFNRRGTLQMIILSAGYPIAGIPASTR